MLLPVGCTKLSDSTLDCSNIDITIQALYSVLLVRFDSNILFLVKDIRIYKKDTKNLRNIKEYIGQNILKTLNLVIIPYNLKKTQSVEGQRINCLKSC